MSSSLHSVFHSTDSLIGSQKRALLAKNAVIAVQYSDTEPMYRTSWEDLLSFARIGPSVFANAMRKAQDGSVPASQIENARDHFERFFCIEQARALAEAFPDFNPEHGFDVDLALIVGNPFDFRTVEVCCEVFPRSDRSRLVTDFASTICHRCPLRVTPEEFGGRDEVVAPLMGLLQGETRLGGEDVSDLARRITRWFRTKGVWPVSGEFLTTYFLNRSISSLVLERGEKIRTASVHKTIGGTHSGAAMGETHLV